MTQAHHVVQGVPRHLGGWRPAASPRGVALPEVPATRPPRCELDDPVPVWDQGSEGSCTAHSNAFLVAWLDPGFDPARQFIYNMTRFDEGTPLSEDSGAVVHDATESMARHGVCSEDDFPYGELNLDVTPPQAAMDAAKAHEAKLWFTCASVDSIKQSIVDGFPVAFGFSVFQSMMTDAVAQSGVIPYPGSPPLPDPAPDPTPHVDPAPLNDAQVGGHSVAVVGYDDSFQLTGECYFKVRNSWGTGWGQGGYGWIPARYFLDGLATDAVTLRRVSP